MIEEIPAKIYYTASLLVPVLITASAWVQHKTTFGMLVSLTSSKPNLLLFLNWVLVLCYQGWSLIISIFFGEIRIIEQKYVMDKSVKKVIQFLLLSIVLRNTFDIYKIVSLLFLFLFCTISWLAKKRGDFLVSRGCREWSEHFKIIVLQAILITLSFCVSLLFYREFSSPNNSN